MQRKVFGLFARLRSREFPTYDLAQKGYPVVSFL